MITDWAIYYQQNKHLPLNKIMENYNKLIVEYSERNQLITQQNQSISSGPAGRTTVNKGSIYSALSAQGKASFDEALTGDFFSVPEADYINVFTTLSGTANYGMDDSLMAEINTSGGANPDKAWTLDSSLVTIPSNSYIIGFVARSCCRNLNATPGTIIPLISTTYKGTYTAIANSPVFNPPNVGEDVSSLQYYLRKNPTTATSATSYLAINATVVYRATNLNDNLNSAIADPPSYSSWTDRFSKVPQQQYLITSTKSW